MVDYSAVRVDYPLVAFFFAHLGCLLEPIEKDCLERVSFFAGEDCPYTSVLSSLFPPVSHSVEVARLLKMSKVIASGGEEVRKKKKVGGKSFLPTLWDDVDAVALKAHEVLSVDDLSPLMAKSSIEVAILTIEAEDDKERVATLEKILQVEKYFCKLKDKQIGDLELKLQTVGATAVQDFKDSDEYSDELCKYYVEGFDLLVKWMEKHHLGLDLSSLAMDDVEKELMSGHPFETIVETVTEGAKDIAEVMEEAAITNPANPVPDEQ
nr:hypothetical protein CFP56_23280 [Quercus suber]